MTATDTGSAVDVAPAEKLRDVTSHLYDLLLQVERHRTGLAHELGLGTTDVAALWEIARRPGLRPGDLSRALGLGVAGTSSVVDKLVRSGFVRREPDPRDRRSLNLALTPAGRHAHGWVEDELALVVAPALAGFDAGTAENVLQALTAGFAATAGAPAPG